MICGNTKRAIYYLVVLVIAGFICRLSSFQKNIYLHGDVVLHCATVENLAHKKGFVVSYALSDLVPLKKPELLGHPVQQHAPLWPLLGAFLFPFVKEAFTSLKILSLLGGMALIPLSFVFACRFFGLSCAYLTAFAVAFSYQLIDYSANGSLYILQAVLFILFVLAADGADTVFRWCMLGCLAGIAWLLNYQNIVMGASICCLYAVSYRGRWLSKENIIKLLACFLVLGITILPWLVRNYTVFGNPFHNINMQYFWGKMGVSSSMPFHDPLIFQKLCTWVPWWTAHNIYYVARELFVLAPVIFACALWGLPHFIGQVIRARKQAYTAGALLVVLYTGICVVWPVVKYRYFVPLLPFVFAFGFSVMHSFQHKTIRKFLMLSAIGVFCLFSVLAFLSVPSRTLYYGGALTKDIFGKRGEAEFIEEADALLDVARFLKSYPPRVIYGEPALHFYTGLPVVHDKTFLRNNEYYLVMPANQNGNDYSDGEVIFSNHKFLVLKCHGVKA
ncbi:MAG: glycosyltransferase family 39 protein [Desulfobacterota bacterium]|nr:glycosyltransferase family 39 protein [Thermodesulfobacteriota bacterium]